MRCIFLLVLILSTTPSVYSLNESWTTKDMLAFVARSLPPFVPPPVTLLKRGNTGKSKGKGKSTQQNQPSTSGSSVNQQGGRPYQVNRHSQTSSNTPRAGQRDRHGDPPGVPPGFPPLANTRGGQRLSQGPQRPQVANWPSTLRDDQVPWHQLLANERVRREQAHQAIARMNLAYSARFRANPVYPPGLQGHPRANQAQQSLGIPPASAERMANRVRAQEIARSNYNRLMAVMNNRPGSTPLPLRAGERPEVDRLLGMQRPMYPPAEGIHERPVSAPTRMYGAAPLNAQSVQRRGGSTQKTRNDNGASLPASPQRTSSQSNTQRPTPQGGPTGTSRYTRMPGHVPSGGPTRFVPPVSTPAGRASNSRSLNPNAAPFVPESLLRLPSTLFDDP